MNRSQIIEQLTPKALLPFTFDPEDETTMPFLEEVTIGVPDAIQRLPDISPDTYRLLERLDVVTNGQVAKLLNDNGFCNSTVCPGCRVDDFTHVEGCKVGFGEQ